MSGWAYQDEDFEIRLECKTPSAFEREYIKLSAYDLELENDDLLCAFSLASKVLIQTKEIEVEDGYEYHPELVVLLGCTVPIALGPHCFPM